MNMNPQLMFLMLLLLPCVTLSSQDSELIPPRWDVYDNGKIYDITHRITAETPTGISQTGIGEDYLRLHDSMRNGSDYNFSIIKLPAHSGTHVDAPGHFYENYFEAGFDVDSLDLRVLNGPALLVDVPRDTNITAEVMKSLNIPKGIRRVLFRTLNTDRRLMWEKRFDTSYVGFMKDGAQWLKDNRHQTCWVLEPVSFDQLNNHRETYEDDARVDIISSSAGFHNSGLELDWLEPSMQQCYSTSALQVPRSDNVCDAFHLLQTDPSVQRMVISLSSDKAVWDAVMNNEVVRELRESIREDKSIYDGSEGGVNGSNPVTQVLCWIFANTKDKVIEIVAKITKVVNELLRPMSKDEKPNRDTNVGLDSFDEKLRRSFFLSIVVLLIVVVSRSGKKR